MDLNNRENKEDFNSDYEEGFDLEKDFIPEIDYGVDGSNNNSSDANSNTNSNTNTKYNDANVNNINKNELNREIKGVNDFHDDDSNDITEELAKEPVQKPVDVRIIVDGHQNSEFLSKAVRNIDFWNDFPIIVSSIVTTDNVEIAKNAIVGADIILIATNLNEEGRKTFSTFYNALKNDFNYVESLRFPKFREAGVPDLENMKTEIKNSIIKAGLSSIFDIANINQVRFDLDKLGEKYAESSDTNEKISLENEMLINEASQLREKNKELSEEIKHLQNHVDEVKLDFADFKSRFSNIHTRNILEIFSLPAIWSEVFNEHLSDENMDKIAIATNKFKPENLIVGQGYVAAQSREDAIDWLKIVKTALIFVEDSSNELKEDLAEYNKTRDNSGVDDTNSSNSYSNSYNSRDTHRNNYSDDEEEDNEDDQDYEIPSQFQNFWD